MTAQMIDNIVNILIYTNTHTYPTLTYAHILDIFLMHYMHIIEFWVYFNKKKSVWELWDLNNKHFTIILEI